MQLVPLKTATDVSLSIHESILSLHRKTRFAGMALTGAADEAVNGLNYASALILLLVDGDAVKNVKELSRLLHLERSWVSRIISSLEKRGLVESARPVHDKRSKELRISEQGTRELARLAALRSKIMDTILAAFGPAEERELQILLGALADSLEAPRLRWAHTHPMDTEIARLSWALGSVGENYLQSGMNVTRYQIFYTLGALKEECFSATSIASLFPVDVSTITRTIVALCDEGLLERKRAADDSRTQLVRLSAKGRECFKELQRLAMEILQRGLNGLTKREATRLSILMQKAGRENSGRCPGNDKKHFETRRIPLSGSLKDGQTKHSSAALAGSRDKSTPATFGLYRSGVLTGVLRIARDHQANLAKVELDVSEANDKELMRFVKAGIGMSKMTL